MREKIKLKSHLISTFSPAHKCLTFILFDSIYHNSFHKTNLRMLLCPERSPYLSVNMQMQRICFQESENLRHSI